MQGEAFEIVEFAPHLFFVAGDIDLATASRFEAAVAPAVQRGGPLTVDISQVRFADSTAMHAFLNVLQSLPTGCLILHGAQAQLRQVVEMVGLAGFAGLHVLGCDQDPYPTRPVPGSADRVMERIENLRARLDVNVNRARDLNARAAALRATAAAIRTTVAVRRVAA